MSDLSLDDLKQKVSLVSYASSCLQLEARGGEHWAKCPFHADGTASFAIRNKAGVEVFYCQGCGKAGSIIDFIELYEHCSTRDAIQKLKEIAGDLPRHNEEWRQQAEKIQAAVRPVIEAEKNTLTLAQWEKHEKALIEHPEALSYLKKVRGIEKETAQSLRFGFVQSTKSHLSESEEYARDKGWILLPRIVNSDKIVAVKLRSICVKAFAQMKGMDAKALYNVDSINAMEPVFVTEGEYDAAILVQSGFSAVSIPNATAKITTEWKVKLKEAACIILAGDNDGKAGSEAMRRLKDELGENTYLLLWPDGCKDANDFFREHCDWNSDIFQTKVLDLVQQAKERLPVGLMSLIKELRTSTGTDGLNDPTRLHFKIPELDRMAYVPLKDAGYVVFYSTYSGTGKSVFTTQIITEEARRGECVIVYTPELSGAQYLALVVAQTLEREINRSLVVTQAQYNEAADVLDKPSEDGSPFQFYVTYTTPSDDPLLFIEETLDKMRPSRFVIDTFPNIVHQQGRESLNEAESRTAVKLEALGKQYGCVFIVVGQSNKEADELSEIRKDSHGTLRGSRVLTDKACAVFLLHRRKKAEQENQEDLLEAETLVKMVKNRYSGPGYQSIKLRYRRERSRFYLQTTQQCGNVSGESALPPSDEQRPW